MNNMVEIACFRVKKGANLIFGFQTQFTEFCVCYKLFLGTDVLFHN